MTESKEIVFDVIRHINGRSVRVAIIYDPSQPYEDAYQAVVVKNKQTDNNLTWEQFSRESVRKQLTRELGVSDRTIIKKVVNAFEEAMNKKIDEKVSDAEDFVNRLAGKK
jgi:hypothetical protein